MTVELMVRPEFDGQIDSAPLVASAEALLEALGVSEAVLCLVLTGDDEVQALNRDYRHKDQPTDVLSFAQEEVEDFPLPPGEPRPLGDVVISLETAARQVGEGCLPRLWPGLGVEAPPPWSLAREVHFLTLHGVLHLLGYDHMVPDDAVEMEAKERALIALALSSAL